MSEQKKPKIDLKARLGKKSVAAPTGPAIPPPVGIPKPPAMGGGRGGGPSQPPPARIDGSNPYAAVEAVHAARAPEPQAIKVEMSEEVVQEQKKAKKRSLVIAAIIATLTFGLGTTLGGSMERGKGATAALEGAQALVKEIEAADQEADKLNEVLGKAAEKLGKSEYPAEEVTALGAINIPFDGGNLTDKGIGRFRRDMVTQLITYANRAQKANEQKEKIQNLLAGSKGAITELLQQKTDPKIRWSVFVVNGPMGPWANMQLLPAPFAATSKTKVKDKDGKEKDYEWPADFPIKDGQQTLNLKRYKSGDPMGSEPQIIPVAPMTESSVCPSTTIVKLRQELVEMQTVLKGDATPGQEKEGLLQLGEQVVQALKKIGTG